MSASPAGLTNGHYRGAPPLPLCLLPEDDPADSLPNVSYLNTGYDLAHPFRLKRYVSLALAVLG